MLRSLEAATFLAIGRSSEFGGNFLLRDAKQYFYSIRFFTILKVRKWFQALHGFAWPGGADDEGFEFYPFD